ncbi:erg24, C-14 sterol reductase, partial [Coemansia helicoidea]
MTLNPRTVHREFFGARGAAAVMSSTVAVLFVWYFSCNEADGCRLPVTGAQWARIAAAAADYRAYVSGQAIAYYALWWAWLALLYFAIPAPAAKGLVLRNGQQLQYPINGLSSFLVTVAAAALAYAVRGVAPFVWIADHYFQLAVASVLFATAQAALVYLYSFRRGPVLLALAGNSGNPVYDFFIGRELNPRIGALDLKFFNELRPGIMGWVLLNASFALKQRA